MSVNVPKVKMAVVLTKQHILCGGMGSSGGHPIAYAFREAGVEGCYVEPPHIMFDCSYGPYAAHRTEMPEWLTALAVHYNDTGEIPEMRFEYEVPDYCIANPHKFDAWKNDDGAYAVMTAANYPERPLEKNW